MTNQDVLTLAKAGFTAQQIAALNAVKPAEATITNVSAPQTKNDSLDQFNKQLQALTGQMQKNDSLDQFNKQLQTLTGQMQKNAIAFMQQPAQQDTDSILAEIINPPSIIGKEGQQ